MVVAPGSGSGMGGGSQGPGQGGKPGLVRPKGAFGFWPEASGAIEGH